MRSATVAVLLVTVVTVTVARADSGPRRTVVAMRATDDKICTLLRAQPGDRCTRLLRDKRGSVYRSGSARGVNRVVVAITAADRVLIGPSVDLVGEDCATGTCVMLDSVTPSVRDFAIDGQPGVVVDLVSKFHAKQPNDKWQTHTVIGCGQTAAGAWKCTTLDAGRCDVAISADGSITSCGAPATLSLR